jgi:hypothetical protein
MNLIADETDHDPAVPIGDIAHVEAASDTGPRANPGLANAERNTYENLILLCKNCHARFDKQKNSSSVDFIKELKRAHEAWVKASLPERGKTRTAWHVVVLRGTHPLDVSTVDAALSPDFPCGDPMVIEIGAAPDWLQTGQMMREKLQLLCRGVDPIDSRFAVFPLAPVSACLYLGYLLTNRPSVRLFQYHRDEQSWVWPDANVDRPGFSVKTVQASKNPRNVAFLFEVSARTNRALVKGLLPRNTTIVSIGVSGPGTGWLRSPRQLGDLGACARSTFEEFTNSHPRAVTWHIFYAGPAPGAVVVGQQLNPTTTPRVQLYEFIHPKHAPSLLVETGPHSRFVVSGRTAISDHRYRGGKARR